MSQRPWIDIEYQLTDTPGFTRPSAENNFRFLENGVIIQHLFPNKNYNVRLRHGVGSRGSDWIYLPMMTTTSEGELLITWEIR